MEKTRLLGKGRSRGACRPPGQKHLFPVLRYGGKANFFHIYAKLFNLHKQTVFYTKNRTAQSENPSICPVFT